MPHTYFISDLHLSAERPAINTLFFSFLENQATKAEALYILGDLFEYWIGDDAINRDPLALEVVNALRKLSNAGTRIYFMAGNRDFLLGDHFATQAGLTILADPTLINLYGKPMLLMHGDTLCTDDVDYQKARRMLRSPAWQQSFLGKPLDERHAIAHDARQQSSVAKAGKSAEIMDASNAAIDEAFRQYHYPGIIHGHTHRPKHHQHQIDGHACQRRVLPDWYERGGGLHASEDAITTFDL